MSQINFAQEGKKGGGQTYRAEASDSDGVIIDAPVVVSQDVEEGEVLDSQESERGRGGAFAPMHEAKEVEPSSYPGGAKQLGRSIVSEAGQPPSKQKPTGRGRQVNSSFKSKRWFE